MSNKKKVQKLLDLKKEKQQQQPQLNPAIQKCNTQFSYVKSKRKFKLAEKNLKNIINYI